MYKTKRQQQVYKFSFQGQQFLINEAAKIPRIKFESGIINSQRNQKIIWSPDQINKSDFGYHLSEDRGKTGLGLRGSL